MDFLRDFLSAHIIKGDIQHVLYNGELDKLNKVVDGSGAEPRIVKAAPLMEWTKVSLRLYGELSPVSVPVFDVTKIEVDKLVDRTIDYKNQISEYMKIGILSDKRGTLLFRLLELFDVVEYAEVVTFKTKDNADLNVIKGLAIATDVNIGGQSIMLNVTDVNDINKYENIILLLKEVSDGYYDIRKHSIVDKVNGKLTQQEYVFGRDIYAELNTKTKEVVHIEQHDTEYNGEKTKDGWMVHTPDGQIIDTKDFQAYKTVQEGDILKVRLVGAFTHVLREILQLKPITWQYKFLLGFKRLNFVAGCRRSGKCLEPHTLLRLADGGLKMAKDITLEDQLLSSDKTTATNLNAIEHYTKDIYRVTLDNGMYIDVTGDHRSPTQKTFSKDGWDLNIDNYKTTLELTTDDFIPVMYGLGINKESTEQEYYEALLAGYMYGDGCRGTSRIAVHSTAIAAKIINICNQLGYKYFYNQDKNFISVHDKGYLKDKYSGLDEYSYNKFLDLNLFKLGTKAKRGLIDGMINTDGCIMLKGVKQSSDGFIRKGNVLIEYCSTSERLSRDYQMMLADLGVISYIRKKKIVSQFNKTKEYSWNVFVSDTESLQKIFNNCDLTGKTNYDLCISHLSNIQGYSNSNIGVIPLEAFKESTIEGEQINDGVNHYRLYNGVRQPRYNFQRNKCENYGIEHWNNYSRHKVISVEFLRHDDVVDIEVDGDHTYRGNNILTHNTYISAYLILREMRRMPNSIRHINRQIRSLYIAPTEDKFKEVTDYIRQSSERVRLLKLIDFNKKENRLSLFDEKLGRNQKTVTTVATCDFTSAKSYEPGRGRASDLIVLDEAAFIPEEVWLNILPIIGNEEAKFFGISTIDWKTNRNWFYEQLVEAEKGLTDIEHIKMYGMRVTIDDLDEILVDSSMKHMMKNSLKDNRPRYYAELYASLPEVGTVFQTDGFYILNKELMSGEKHGAFIIGYDPAKRTDIGAVIVSQYKVNAAGEQVCNLIEEYELGGRYEDQKLMLGNIKSKYRSMYPGSPVVLLIDATAAGDVIAEMFGDIIDYKIWYTAAGKRPEIDAYGAWKVPKSHLVHLSQLLIEKGIIKSWIGLKGLMEELKNFKKIETPSGGFKYEAETGHDDHVNAMMLVGFYLGYVEGRIYGMNMGGETIAPDGIESNTNLYRSESRRGQPLNVNEEFPFMEFGFGL